MLSTKKKTVGLIINFLIYCFKSEQGSTWIYQLVRFSILSFLSKISNKIINFILDTVLRIRPGTSNFHFLKVFSRQNLAKCHSDVIHCKKNHSKLRYHVIIITVKLNPFCSKLNGFSKNSCLLSDVAQSKYKVAIHNLVVVYRGRRNLKQVRCYS